MQLPKQGGRRRMYCYVQSIELGVLAWSWMVVATATLYSSFGVWGA